MLLRILDTETTGTDAASDHVVEIASVDMKSDARHITFNRMQTFVRPPKPIPPEASAIHHIIDPDVSLAPALAAAVERFKGADIYVAHKASFEAGFLPMLAAPWICTYRCAVMKWPDAPGFSNQTIRYWLRLPVDRSENVHRAGGDAEVTARILAVLLDTCTIEQLLEWSGGAAILPRVFFGKQHRGKRWSEVPVDFLEWILRAGDFDPDILATARHWLDRHEARAA